MLQRLFERPAGTSRRVALVPVVLVTLAWTGIAGAQEPEQKSDDRRAFTVEGGATTGRGRPGQGSRDIAYRERPLKDLLAFLSMLSGYNIIVKDDKLGVKLVTIVLTRVHWNTVLEVLAAKYKLIIDRRQMTRARIIYVESPIKVSLKLRDSDLRPAIQLIADWGNANIVIGKDVKGAVTLTLDQVPWKKALEVVLKTNGYVLVEEEFDILRVATPSELELQLETRVFNLSYLMPTGARYIAVMKSPFLERVRSTVNGGKGQDDTLINVIKEVLSKSGKLAFAKRTNSVVVTDTPAKLEVIRRLIEKLDVPPKQVHLSLRLVELNDDDMDMLGMNWGPAGLTFQASGMAFDSLFPFLGHRNRRALSTGTFGNIGAAAPRPIDPTTGNLLTTGVDPSGVVGLGVPAILNQTAPAGSGLNLGRLSFQGLTAVLNIIRTMTKGRVIQAPQLIALDNEEATIQVGELVRYAESFVQTNEQGGVASGFQEAKNSPVTLGIQLLVIPHVTGPDNNILLTVIPKTETFTDPSRPFEEFVGGNLGTLRLPQTSQRIVVTKMMLRNGETAVIGGLREEVEGTTTTKIPLLGDIPLFGWLFRHRQTKKQTRNLLIFITPQVIDFDRVNDLDQTINRLRQDASHAFSAYDLGETTETPAARTGGARVQP